jgi:hypothetical protein
VRFCKRNGGVEFGFKAGKRPQLFAVAAAMRRNDNHDRDVEIYKPQLSVGRPTEPESFWLGWNKGLFFDRRIAAQPLQQAYVYRLLTQHEEQHANVRNEENRNSEYEPRQK